MHNLTSEPDLTYSMYFLNKMKNNPKIHVFLKLITRMFVYSYFQKAQPKWALKNFQWASRSNFPNCDVGGGFYAFLVNGFCKYNMVFEALKVLKVIVSENLVVEDEDRLCIYSGLLRERLELGMFRS